MEPMFGWFSEANRRASRSKRARRSGSAVQIGQDLDRHVATEVRVVGAIHLAHAASAEGTRDSGTARTGSPPSSRCERDPRRRRRPLQGPQCAGWELPAGRRQVRWRCRLPTAIRRRLEGVVAPASVADQRGASLEAQTTATSKIALARFQLSAFLTSTPGERPRSSSGRATPSRFSAHATRSIVRWTLPRRLLPLRGRRSNRVQPGCSDAHRGR